MGLIASSAARRSRRLLVCSGLALALVLLLGPAGALAAAGRRIGSKPSLPSGAKAVGALSQSTQLSVTVTLQPRDPAALAAYATAVSTPGSSEYHDYLSVAEFAHRFGPTASAIAAAETSLRARGLSPGKLSANGLSFSVTATAARLASGFQTSFERYHLRSGRTAYANTSAPQVTGSGASVVQSVIGLSNLAVEKPEGVTRNTSASTRGATVSHTVTSSGVTACSAATTDGGGSYTAAQIAGAYGFDGLYGAGDFGSGVTVALYELEPYAASDVSSYQSCYGTSVPVTNVSVDGGSSCDGDPNCRIEDTLDIEDVIGLAPGVHISVYEGPNTGPGAYDTYAQIVSDDTAKVISTSWGLCEAEEGSGAADAENTLFQEAATQGQTVFAAAGDSGAQDCTDSIGNPTGGQAVDDPASQPYVTGVGGTSLTLSPSYSEIAWNDVVYGGAGGGGVSQLWLRPSYQSGFALAQSAISCGSGGHTCREVPDVSADADENPGYDVYWDGFWQPIGGTSAATPTWASLLALAEASSDCAGAPLGFLNPLLYGAASSDYSADFNDITSGNNSYDGVTGYSAGTGYDMASGLGSPKGTALTATICTGHDTVTFAAAPTAQTTDAGKLVAPFTVSAVSSLGKTPITYSATGLPPGVTIGATTGTVSGRPTAGGAYAVTLDATDHYGTVGTESFTWVVRGNPHARSGRVHVSGRTGSLTLTLRSGRDSPELKTVRLIAPRGARFSGRSSVLSRSVRAVTLSGAQQAISRKVSGRRLTVTFSTTTSASRLKLSGAELTLTKSLARGLAHRTKRFKLTLVMTDASGTQTRVTLTLR